MSACFLFGGAKSVPSARRKSVCTLRRTANWGTFNTRKMMYEIPTLPLPYLTRLFIERSKLLALQLVEVKLYYDSNSNSDKSTNQMQQPIQFII
jgi:hypothetical protein